ncbi:MAG: MbcA/ParS/Xre antitoxin family protein [Bacteroidales bacterium]|nr:MbcA/ParS/Xre antitoxin family protein [Bacteroidales bacterium]
MYPIPQDETDWIVNEEAVSLILSTRQGLSFDFFTDVLKYLPIKFTEWSKFLHLSDRTMQRYKKEKKSFDAPYSEKILEITLLYQNGAAVFGSKAIFNEWMNSDNTALGGSKPKALLDSTFGIHLIKDEIIRIEQGIIS